MNWFSDAFGIELDEQTLKALIYNTVEHGKTYPAYTKGCYYINEWYGDAQICLHLKTNNEKQELEVVGSDLHATSNTHVKLVIEDVLKRIDSDDPLERRVLAAWSEYESPIIVNILNSDILPRWTPGTTIDVQMVLLATSMDIYETEDEFVEKTGMEVTLPGTDGPKPFVMGMGSVIPLGTLSPLEEDFSSQDLANKEGVTLITGVVKEFNIGQFKVKRENEDEDDIRLSSFLMATVETLNYGDIVIISSLTGMSYEYLRSFHPGMVVQAYGYLSADALLDSKVGVVLNKDRNLDLLLDVFTHGSDANRLFTVLAEDCIYSSQGVVDRIEGRDAIIEYIEKKRSKQIDESDHYKAYRAIITDTENGVDLKYGIDEECVILSRGEDDHYVAIVFIEMDENDQIAQIELITDSRYKFKVLN